MAALLVAAPSQSQTPPTSVAELLLQRYDFKDEDVGYLLFDLTTGDRLASHRPDEPRIPASTSKLVVTSAALQILGADYRFATTLLTTGAICEGVLYGGVFLRGGGDPTLTTDDLREFVAALQGAGVKRVVGRFAFDDSLLPTTRAINPQHPVAVSYNPGVSALSVNYNRIFLNWRRKPNSAAFKTLVLSPADGGPVVIDAITTSMLPGVRDRRIKFIPDGAQLDRWLLSPALPARGAIDLPIRNNPGRVTALLFRTLCRQHGIDLPVPQAAVTPPTARTLFTHYSAPLPDIITRVLRYSNNLAAELIGQVATRRLTSHALALHESAAAIASWYRRTLPTTDWRGFQSLNHSGLSSQTRHSPQQLADILRYAWSTRLGGVSFPDLLSPPPWGNREERIRDVVKAKSGTMSYADGLAGYLTAATGRQLGFVILLTDFAKRAALDATCNVQLAEQPPEAQTWTGRAKAFERALVTTWALQY
ncbi:MAG TPA: D-alanyl-D-alanine carboxypeptidase/D-alanyl-D-alanine-endopeptidase [Methylomirabilota bacterium]|nr:D-alanyl-D-alanine carboxypeptidase/D-alanyl-D-alanine-endopeptidase [Methylomirabilota bacterium]